MPRIVKELGPLDIKRARHEGPPNRHFMMAVGGVSGLLLQISPTNGKSWLLRTVAGSKRRAFGLGPYPEVSLADARAKARERKMDIEGGSDPVVEKKAAREKIEKAQAQSITFAEAAKKYIKMRGVGFRNDKHLSQWTSTLKTYAEPVIGKKDVGDITTQDVLQILAPIWESKTETATRVRGRIEAVLTWATVSGLRSGDNPARWGGHIKELLAPPSKVANKKHYPAVPVARAADWWSDLAGVGGQGAAALRFLTLCASRSGEVRGAEWKEIDLDAAIWTVPADRMKAHRLHRVPLSPAAVDLLKSLPRFKVNSLVFPGAKGAPLSDMTLSKVMRDMQEREAKAGREGWLDDQSGRPAVPHGLRSTFRDWCADSGVERDVAELCLAHTVGSSVERAYRRSDMIERRRPIMAAWAAFIDGRASGAVIPFPVATGIAA